MKKINVKLGKRLTFLIGSGISLTAAAWIYLRSEHTIFVKYELFVVSVLLGISSTTMLITSLGLTNDLIGGNTVSCYFNGLFSDK